MNMQEYCASGDDPREYLHTPFKVGNWVVACNGRRAIARPLNGDEALREAPKTVAERIPGLLGLDDDKGFVPMPEITLPPFSKCKKCSGLGVVTVKKCCECNGIGTVDAETDYNTYYDLTCKSCDGAGEERVPGGEAKCSDCSGLGTRWQMTDHVMVLQTPLQPRYAKALIGHPEMEVRSNVDEFPKLHFRCGQYRGVIMGMRV